jgi:hypothetical protein
MTTVQLIDRLDSSEAILPKDLLSHSSVHELVKLVTETYDDTALRNKIVSSKQLYENYLSLVNYLLVVHLNEKNRREKPIFRNDLINGLLTLPEPA